MDNRKELRSLPTSNRLVLLAEVYSSLSWTLTHLLNVPLFLHRLTRLFRKSEGQQILTSQCATIRNSAELDVGKVILDEPLKRNRLESGTQMSQQGFIEQPWFHLPQVYLEHSKMS
jgi:hypothetical protein